MTAVGRCGDNSSTLLSTVDTTNYRLLFFGDLFVKRAGGLLHGVLSSVNSGTAIFYVLNASSAQPQKRNQDAFLSATASGLQIDLDYG